jgi:hypothetical protein
VLSRPVMTNRPRKISGPSGYGVITALRSASCHSAAVSRSGRSGLSSPVVFMTAGYPAGCGVHASHAAGLLAESGAASPATPGRIRGGTRSAAEPLAERDDRNLAELIQELRVVSLGVQVPSVSCCRCRSPPGSTASAAISAASARPASCYPPRGHGLRAHQPLVRPAADPRRGKVSHPPACGPQPRCGRRRSRPRRAVPRLFLIPASR